nr:ABC transporter permease [Clostridioides difficile]
MLKLIKLEWKKNHIEKYIRNVFILAIILCLFVFALAFLGIANDPESGVLDATPGNNIISAPIELFTSMSFLIFTSVMLSSFIVSAYKNKTMNLMFSYPIKRKKILLSQILAVWIFNFAALILTRLLIYGCILLGSQFMTSSFLIDFNMGNSLFYVQLILKSVVLVSMSFIALFIGIISKSSKATIITSFLLIFLTQANVGDFTLSNNMFFPIILTVISLVFAFLSIHNAETKDLM